MTAPTDEPVIESVRRLTLGPDDTLVFRSTSRRLSQDEADTIRRRLQDILGEDAKVLVVSRDWELTVIGPDA